MEQFAVWLPEYRERFESAAEKWTLGATIELKAIRRQRSLSQNARYWALVGELADYVGCSKDEMHTQILCEYHGHELKEVFGQIIKVPKGRSHNLTTTDFSDLMDIADRWAAMAGVVPHYQ